MKWDYAILATGKTHFSNVKTSRINNKIAFGTKFKVENKCRLTIVKNIFLNLEVLKYVVCLCRGCDGCCVF